MTQIVVKGGLRDQLAGCREATDLVDESGRRLGTYVPEPICPWEPTLTEAEVDRREEGPARAWPEIRERLEKMRSSA